MESAGILKQQLANLKSDYDLLLNKYNDQVAYTNMMLDYSNKLSLKIKKMSAGPEHTACNDKYEQIQNTFTDHIKRCTEQKKKDEQTYIDLVMRHSALKDKYEEMIDKMID